VSRQPSRLDDYLNHILEAIERIEQYTEDMDEMSFLGRPLVQDAVIRNIEVIGEAANNIAKRYPEFGEEHSDLPLSFAYQMRNIVAHGYFKVDLEIVWRTIQVELPEFYLRARAALNSAQ